MRRRVKGDRAFVNLIKAMPDAVRGEVVNLLRETGAQVLTEQRLRAKKRTGASSSALSMKVLPTSMRLQVGFIGKPTNRRFFYARIIQSGRKTQIVRFKRKGLTASKRTGKPYLMRIRGMAPHNFIFPYTREQLAAPFRSLWDRILKRASAGVGDE